MSKEMRKYIDTFKNFNLNENQNHNNSKIKDVLYRGEKTDITNNTKNIYYFTPNYDYAKNYGDVKEYYLNVNKILDFSDAGEKRFNRYDLINYLKLKLKNIANEEIDDILSTYDGINTNMWQFVYDYRYKLKPILDRDGFDVIKLIESYENEQPSISYAVFDKEKILKK